MAIRWGRWRPSGLIATFPPTATDALAVTFHGATVPSSTVPSGHFVPAGIRTVLAVELSPPLEAKSPRSAHLYGTKIMKGPRVSPPGASRHKKAETRQNDGENAREHTVFEGIDLANMATLTSLAWRRADRGEISLSRAYAGIKSIYFVRPHGVETRKAHFEYIWSATPLGTD